MRILIAEDDETTRLKLEALLTRLGHDVVAARDGDEAWILLDREDAPSLVILDWLMPGLDGVEVCRRVRHANRSPYTYILMLTIKGEIPDLVTGMEAGADDYISKPFDLDELRVRLGAGERVLNLHSELRLLGTHDDLTGLLNRGTVRELLQREMALVARTGVSVGLILADLDNFKRVNDTRGHGTGDAVLREASKRMSACIRPYDALGRWGGEEFLTVLPGCGMHGALEVAERMRSALSDLPIALRNGSVTVTASLGVAVADAGANMDIEELIRAADDALYRAKAEGRNRVIASGKRNDDPPADPGPQTG